MFLLHPRGIRVVTRDGSVTKAPFQDGHHLHGLRKFYSEVPNPVLNVPLSQSFAWSVQS